MSWVWSDEPPCGERFIGRCGRRYWCNLAKGHTSYNHAEINLTAGWPQDTAGSPTQSVRLLDNQAPDDA